MTKFSSGELICVFVNSVIAKLFLVFPSQLYELAGSASILLSVYITIIGFIVCVVCSKLYDKHSFKNNKLISIIFILMFVMTTGLLMRCWVESIRITVMPTAPSVYIYLFFVIGMVFVAYLGLKSIVRLHSILVPIIIAAVFALFFGNSINFDFNSIYPVLGNGWQIFWSGILLIVYISDMAVLYFLMPYAKSDVNFKKVCFRGWAISSAVMLLIVSMYVLVINRNISGELNLPVYRLARFLRLGENASHFESVFSIPWFLSFLLLGSLYLYLGSKLCNDVLNKDNSTLHLIFLTLIIVVIAAVPKDTTALIKYVNVNSIYKIIAGIALPQVYMFCKRKRVK